MSRLAKRVQKLEGGVDAGTDIIAEVPHVWSSERQSEEVEAIARAHGVTRPFRMMIFIQDFDANEDDDAKILMMGRLGVDRHLDQPLTGNMKKDRQKRTV